MLVVLQDVFSDIVISKHSPGQQPAPRGRVKSFRNMIGKPATRTRANFAMRITHTCIAPVTYSPPRQTRRRCCNLTPMPSRRQNASAV
jgi:hypothetical protein